MVCHLTAEWRIQDLAINKELGRGGGRDGRKRNGRNELFYFPSGR